MMRWRRPSDSRSTNSLALGDEVLAEAREEEVELVAAIAFHGVGVQIELDEEVDDVVVLAA